MTAREYLEQGRHIDLKISYCIKDADWAKEKLRLMLSTCKGISCGEEYDEKFKEHLQAFAEARERYAAEAERYLHLKQEISAVIQAVPDENQKIVLLMHFMQGMTYEEIGNELKYSPANIKKLIRSGLENIKVPESVS